MNDRELLELSAKAAGMKGWQWVESWGSMAEKRLLGGFYFDRYWNPLEDDGDALRLAVKLEITIDWGCFDVVAKNYDEDVVTIEKKGMDSCAATRRAIVRAAAEIGKKTNEH